MRTHQRTTTLLVLVLLLSLLPVGAIRAQSSETAFTGTLQTVSGMTIIVDGLNVDTSTAEVTGILTPGAVVYVVGVVLTDNRIDATIVLVITPAATEGDSGDGDGSNTISDDPSATCPLTQGFWKNHPDAWQVDMMTLGQMTYPQADLLALLHTESGGDASLTLAHQLIAAHLNMENGADATTAQALFAEADALLASYDGPLPYGVDPASDDGQLMVALAADLDRYNNRYLTPSCDRASLPTTIVVEGPVTAINVNIVTIYNFEVEFEEDDPLLTVLAIGDELNVAGDVTMLDDTAIIVVINVIVINVEIFISDDGQVWRDPGNCGAAPPPWAPANGWHRRCDGGGGSGHNGSSGSRS